MTHDERDAEIIRLRNKGMPQRVIAHRMGISPDAVAGVIHKARYAAIKAKEPHIRTAFVQSDIAGNSYAEANRAPVSLPREPWEVA